MAVRPGMTDLIAELRGLTDTATDQYEVGGVSYWTDDHIQNALDLFVVDLNDVQLTPEPLHYNGYWEYRRFYIPKNYPHWLESDTVVVLDHEGKVTTTPYTYYDYRRLFEFTKDVDTAVTFLRAVAYNMNLAAAHIWEMKASHTARLVEFKAGQTSIKENQEHEQCLKMARMFKNKSGVKTSTIRRSDYGQVKVRRRSAVDVGKDDSGTST